MIVSSRPDVNRVMNAVTRFLRVLPVLTATISGCAAADPIRRSIGVRWHPSNGEGIELRDDIDLLVFIHDNRVARSVAHPRSRGDFGPEIVGN